MNPVKNCKATAEVFLFLKIFSNMYVYYCFRYTRNLISKGIADKYNLMALCWGEGHGSAIHDHADAHCFMKMLQGELQETRFAWPDKNNPDEPLKETGRSKMPLNGVCYINDSLGLHRVENPSHTEPAVSLHLYCPPFQQCGVFNQQTGQRSVCTVTFWSQYGERRNRVSTLFKPWGIPDSKIAYAEICNQILWIVHLCS